MTSASSRFAGRFTEKVLDQLVAIDKVGKPFEQRQHFLLFHGILDVLLPERTPRNLSSIPVLALSPASFILH